MCMNPNGRPSCDAFVRFTNREQRDLALKRNGSKFGNRNLEVCTTLFVSSEVLLLLINTHRKTKTTT